MGEESVRLGSAEGFRLTSAKRFGGLSNGPDTDRPEGRFLGRSNLRYQVKTATRTERRVTDWDNQRAALRALSDWQRQQETLRQFRESDRVLEGIRREQMSRDAALHATLMREYQLTRTALGSLQEYFTARSALDPPTQLRHILSSLSAFRSALEHLEPEQRFRMPHGDWAATQASLEAALRFLPHARGGADAEIGRQLQRIQEAVAEAPLLGHALISDAEEVGSEFTAFEERAGAQLVALAPADALSDLEEVSFAPLRWLDAALRDPHVMLQLGPREFEEFTAALVERLGISIVQLTSTKADGGRDILGTVCTAGLEFVVALECKRYSSANPVGVETARALLGTITHGGFRADKGVLVTTSRFTKGATSFIVTAPQLSGVDFEGLKRWLTQLRTH